MISVIESTAGSVRDRADKEHASIAGGGLGGKHICGNDFFMHEIVFCTLSHFITFFLYIFCRFDRFDYTLAIGSDCIMVTSGSLNKIKQQVSLI
jgi:hypothetical protein